MTEQKTISISPELYNAIQQLKPLFKELSGEDIQSDEEVIWILISWFIDSFRDNMQGEWVAPHGHNCKCGEWQECDCDWNCKCEDKPQILLS